MRKVNFNTPNSELIEVKENTSYVDADIVYNIEVNVDHTYLINGIVVKNCRCRWIHINPEYQYVNKDGQIKLRVENEDEWQEWYEDNIIKRGENGNI